MMKLTRMISGALMALAIGLLSSSTATAVTIGTQNATAGTIVTYDSLADLVSDTQASNTVAALPGSVGLGFDATTGLFYSIGNSQLSTFNSLTDVLSNSAASVVACGICTGSSIRGLGVYGGTFYTRGATGNFLVYNSAADLVANNQASNTPTGHGGSIHALGVHDGLFYGYDNLAPGSDVVVWASFADMIGNTQLSNDVTPHLLAAGTHGLFVPEPGSLMLVGSGLLGLGALGRRRNA